MPFNGPARELESDEHMIVENGESELVYCVSCGNTFVWAQNRDCPTCTLAEMIKDVPSEIRENLESELEENVSRDSA